MANRKSPAQPSAESDARGQSEKNHEGGDNNGVSSAEPRVISGDEEGDATFPLQNRKKRPKDN
ncbi:hypothetical protein [Mesorhizobium sp. B2-1-3A]|uniref:hypothetical protein n=1 Tax=Mesorhizobium sp. B2-1-3A TaxID=2589971 RepID=UPI0011270BA9|nr:hypothetical protein [Mesorhizobium sp. B2-1-3A]TPM95035.1 hypothetical protein FJ977_23635 [Mesorhizobium sp. B2-1-3A]